MKIRDRMGQQAVQELDELYETIGTLALGPGRRAKDLSVEAPSAGSDAQDEPCRRTGRGG